MERNDIAFQRRLDNVLEFDELRRNPREGSAGEKGIKNEERALMLINTLLDTELSGIKHRCWETHLANPFSIQDNKGYDVIIPTNKGEIGIQIKSSLKSLENFYRKHPSIPCIVVNEYRSDERILIELRAAILHKYRNL